MRIFLVGFMGCGKSHWGKLWAEINNMIFIDLDEVIEAAEKKKIATIFEEEGEAYFRLKETATLRTMVNADNCIIACGGGTPSLDNNMTWMNENGLTIYLSATAQQLMHNILREKQKRPLIKDSTETTGTGIIL